MSTHYMLSKKKICFSVEREITNLNIDISQMQLAMNWITDKYASKTPRPNELKLGRKQQESPVAAMFVNGSGRNEQSL
jgi:hypothetical protein